MARIVGEPDDGPGRAPARVAAGSEPAARLYGQICAAVRAAGREPRKRASDLMIAATAASNQLQLYTANLDDFKGAEGFVEMVGIQAQPNNL